MNKPHQNMRSVCKSNMTRVIYLLSIHLGSLLSLQLHVVLGEAIRGSVVGGGRVRDSG